MLSVILRHKVPRGGGEILQLANPSQGLRRGWLVGWCLEPNDVVQLAKRERQLLPPHWRHLLQPFEVWS